MELPNIHFQDFPIEFKEINPSDFPHFEVREKIVIAPNEEGYINEVLQENINLEEKNTVVINAAVGQGKTYSIIRILKRYYEAEQDYLIFVASPFVSLVQQYYKEIIKLGIPESQIYRYENIGDHPETNYTNKKIQIITVNGLLGNPGDDAFINSEAKREYLNNLKQHCESTGKKVVIIYDEIHDAIHNFKEEYILNLWKWRNVIHKNFVISATFNEASKVVIEYLAELTDNKIQIIESKRTRIPKNQSKLFLHYNNAKYYKYNNDDIVNIVRQLINNDKAVDILCYSKTLSESIIENKNEGIGKELYKKYTEINNCTSELSLNQRLNKLEPQNRYDNEKCNVGTNFKTGVSIEKTNHAFVIIMPPSGTKLPFQNAFGIFSNGIISVIQALARQRKRGGEIHIIIPPPAMMDYESIPFKTEKQQKKFIKFYKKVSDYTPTNVVKYYSFNTQNELIKDFYENTLKVNIEQEISYIDSIERPLKVRLDFPEYKLYLLNKGEKYLANTYPFFGSDLSAFITYCASTNQFINCNLEGVSFKSIKVFQEGFMQLQLEIYYKDYMDIDLFNGLYVHLNDFYYYLEFKNELFKKHKVRLKVDEDYKPLKPYTHKNFEVQLLGFIQRKRYPNNPYFRMKYHNLGQFRDYSYSRSDYFMACISHANNFNIDEFGLNESFTSRINTFRTLDYFRNKLIDNFQQSSTRNREIFDYLPKTPFRDFITSEELPRFEAMITELSENDYFLKNNIFEFKRRFEPTIALKTKKVSFYNMLLKDFFVTEDFKLSTGSRPNVKIILNTFEIPPSNGVLDLVSPAGLDPIFEEHQPTIYDIWGESLENFKLS
ncbi:DEAD/DEAH box helicase [Apibacter muscae]|uniref:DEAD/DEAH box helicase family protein n=1 Tax=Apibacter muscae TaxID=2509004 RepID=UPI0011ACE5D8|nr:DEAD/DEAH box helicase family protein [Apibacter muscae]TWP22511.1 DEAD/DEAH box helicase [Apibacter muscae]